MRRRSTIVALAATGLLLGGCGGGNDSTSAADSARTPSGAMTFTPIPIPSPAKTKTTTKTATKTKTKAPVATSAETPDAAIGKAVAVEDYADAYCQAILDDRTATTKLQTALRTKPADTLESVRGRYTEQLAELRLSALKIANDVREAGSPKIEDGRKLAADVRTALTYVDLVDEARGDLEAVDADKPKAWAAAAGKIVQKLQSDVRKRRAALQSAPDSSDFDTAVDDSSVCRKL